VHRLRALSGLRDLGSPHAAGHLSAVLFFLCGLLVAASSPALGDAPHVHHLFLVVVGIVAASSGFVIGSMPWHRWPRSATLWLVPLSLGLIGLPFYLAGGLMLLSMFMAWQVTRQSKAAAAAAA